MGAHGLAAPRHLILLLVALFGASCASFEDTFHVSSFLHEQVTGDTWRACLGREYQVQTRSILRQGRDWAAASQLSSKGWTALRDGDVAPWQAGDLGVAASRRSEFDTARRELSTALANGRAAPCPCARAQAAYDGWIAASVRPGSNEAAAQTDFSDAIATCRQEEARHIEAH